MKKVFPELPGWGFYLEETSSNVYRVIAKDSKGRIVSRTGTDIDELVEQCKRDVKEIESSLGEN